MTLRLRRPKLLVSAVEPSSAKGPGWKWANMFSRLFHHPERYSGLPHNIHLPQPYLRSWGQDASVLLSHRPPASACATLNQLRTLPLASGALSCCHLPQSIQLAHAVPPGPKEVSRSQSRAVVGHRLPPFSYFPPEICWMKWQESALTVLEAMLWAESDALKSCHGPVSNCWRIYAVSKCYNYFFKQTRALVQGHFSFRYCKSLLCYSVPRYRLCFLCFLSWLFFSTKMQSYLELQHFHTQEKSQGNPSFFLHSCSSGS